MSYRNKGTVGTTIIVSRYPDSSGNWICDGVADDVAPPVCAKARALPHTALSTRMTTAGRYRCRRLCADFTPLPRALDAFAKCPLCAGIHPLGSISQRRRDTGWTSRFSYQERDLHADIRGMGSTLVLGGLVKAHAPLRQSWSSYD